MADPKKPEPSADSKHAMEIGLAVFFIYLLWIAYSRLQQYLIYSNIGTLQSLWEAFSIYFMLHLMPIIKVLGGVVVVLSTIGAIYNYYKLRSIIAEEKVFFGIPEDSNVLESGPMINSKWQHVLELINSMNPSDWRQAIIEADIMLDDLLKASGYHGDSLGEMLKSVEKSDFTTIEDAWEAHKVRNQVAHQGSDFLLNDREARRVISLYERVFREFRII